MEAVLSEALSFLVLDNQGETSHNLYKDVTNLEPGFERVFRFSKSLKHSLCELSTIKTVSFYSDVSDSSEMGYH